MTHVHRSSAAPVRPASLDDALDVFVSPGHGPETDLGRPLALEVHQFWGPFLLQTQHFTPTTTNRVTVGSTLGWRWSLLGVDLAWVPEPLARILPALPPLWSEVRQVSRTDFAAELATGPEHDLFVVQDGHWFARVPETWASFATRDGRRHSLDDLLARGTARREGKDVLVSLDHHAILVEVGELVFVGRTVTEGRRLPERHSGPVPWGFLSTLAFWLFLGSMFGALVMSVAPPPGVTLAEYQDRFPTVRLRPPPPTRPAPQPDDPRDANEDAPTPTRKPRVTRHRDRKASVDVAQAESDRSIATRAGIADALDGLLGDSTLGQDLEAAASGLIGARGGVGIAGLGSRGDGLGGGGHAVSIGGMGTSRPGGRPPGPLTKRPPANLGRIAGEPLIIGEAVDRGLIDAVIQRHMNQIRYCYQRELNQNPNLSGKVVMNFTIARDGGVSQARIKRSSVGHAGVENCLVGLFLRMTFPVPKGGGLVIVSYPLLFSAM